MQSFTLYKNNKTISYRELMEQISTFAVNLEGRSSTILKESNKECEIFLSSVSDFIVAMFGALYAGFCVYIVQKPSGKRMLIDEKNYHMLLNEAQCPNTSIKTLRDIKDIDLKSKIFLQTSGSSGSPKLFIKSLGQMFTESEFLCDFFAITKDEIFASSASHQHLYGLTFKVFLPLVSGSVLHDIELIYSETILDFLSDLVSERINLIMTPIMLDTLCKYTEFKHKKEILLPVQRIFSAGGKLDSHIWQALCGVNIIEIYGGTEMGVVACNRGEGFVRFPPVELSLDKENRLIISSPWQKNETRSPFLSGDCARIDGDKLTLLGRYDRIIKLHEKRVSLDALEAKLMESPFISRAYIGLKEGENRLSALIVLTQEGKQFFRKFGKKGLVQNLQKYLKPDFDSKLRYFYIREKLPYNIQGKITNQEFLHSLESKITPQFILLEKNINTFIVQGFISEACFYFDGHFPNFPLVPGFIELTFVYQNLSEHFGIDTSDIVGIDTIKWLKFLRPLDFIRIEVERVNDKISFVVSLSTEGKIFEKCANGRMRLKSILTNF